MKIIKIKDRRLGYGQPVFVIAEAGVNHNGRLDLAIKLINAAKKVGADAVKFQTWRTENILVKGTAKAEYQKADGAQEDQFEMIKKCELPYGDFVKLNDYAKKIGIMLFTTPDDLESVRFAVKKLRVPLIKIGSAELTNWLHLQKIARYRLPMIISTGMANLLEVKQAVSAIEKVWPNPNLAILQCTTAYPTLPKDANLCVIQSYIQEFPRYVIGFSDHTQETFTSAIAVGLGAKIIEKHFTLDNNLSGPDHQASLNPVDFRTMVSQIRLAEKMLGSSIKKPTTSEIMTRKVVERFLVAARDIKKGEIISEKMVTAKRTSESGGLNTNQLSSILGKKTKKLIVVDKLIKNSNLV